MKTKFFNICVLLYCLFLIACCSVPNETTNDYTPEDNWSFGNSREPLISLTLVKFTDDTYSDYIIAEYVSGKPTMRVSIPPLAEELIVGKKPYTYQLPNGFWIVDWRWDGNFIYPPSNVLLPYKWSTLEHWNDTWDMPENRFEFYDYIEEVRGVTRYEIDKQFNGLIIDELDELYFRRYYMLPFIYYQYRSLSDIPSGEIDEYLKEVNWQDSLHSVYIDKLELLVSRGMFYSISIKFF